MYPTFGVLGGISGEPVSCRAPNPTKMKESSNIKEKALLLTILCIPMLLLCPVYPCCTCLVWCSDCVVTSTSLENRYADYCSYSLLASTCKATCSVITCGPGCWWCVITLWLVFPSLRLILALFCKYNK